MSETYFVEHLGTDVEYSQSEASGFSVRIGNHAWVVGRYDYREKSCPSWWPRIRITIGHRPYPWRKRRWTLIAFGRTWFDLGKP